MHRLAPLCRLLLAAVMGLLVAGCAAKQPAAPGSDAAGAVFETFLANQGHVPAPPAFSLAGSMSFSRGHRSGRLNYRLFGNPGQAVRLDLTTAVGGSYALLFEDKRDFIAYVPSRDTVYRHTDSRQGAARLGMPLPYTLGQMAALASGRFGGLVPDRYVSVKAVEGGYRYAFSGDARLSALTLDFAGHPRHLTGVGVEPWRIAFDNDEPAPGLPAPVARKLTLTTPGGASLILRVKSLQSRPAPYPAADLELPVPSHAVERALDGSEDAASLPEL